MNRCGSFPLLSAPHSLFSIWTVLERSEKIPGAPAWRCREWICLTWPSGPKFTTGVKYQFNQGFWPDHRYGNPNDPSTIHRQDGREISAIIVTGDYLCYKEPKSSYNFFLILIFNELFKFKTSDERQHWKTASPSLDCKGITFSLRRQRDPFAFFTALPRRSYQKINMKYYFILRTLHRR